MACTADPTTTLLGATRRRTLAACDACKQARRRCSGGASCSECVKRGFACIYSPSTKKRGPRFTTSVSFGRGGCALSERELAVSTPGCYDAPLATSQLRPAYATLNKVEAPALPPCAIGYPLGIPGAAPSMEFPLLSPSDVCLLRRVFSFTNQMVKVG